MPPSEGDPDGEPLVELGPDEPSDVAPAADEEGVIVPCDLVTTQDWFDYAQELPAAALLEDGEACGWEAGDGDMRLAIGVFRAAGNSRWLGADDSAAGTAVDGLGDRATWLTSWPVPQSSTLVIEVGSLDLVVEYSARGDTWPARALEMSQHFGEIALSRLP